MILAILGLAVASVSPAQSDYPTTEFGGRLQLDYTYYDNDIAPLDSGGEVRRGRLFVSGELAPRWSYKVQYDFAPDDPELKDGYVRYQSSENSRVSIGHIKMPFSLETLTSSKYVTFLERASLAVLSIERRLGVGYQRWGERYNFGVAVHGDEANNRINSDGIAARFVFTPWVADKRLLHLGLSFSQEQPDGSQFRIRARPESHFDSTRLVNSGQISSIDDINRWGGEAAYVTQRFSAQAQWIGLTASRDQQPDVDVEGGYIYASYFLTDDHRPYKLSNGAFDRVKPTGSNGAWEIALRYSTLDLTDADVFGGEMNNVTLGLNWYATSHLRFGANWIQVNTDRVAGDDDPSLMTVRVQYDF